MSFVLPNPTVPTNGQLGDATPILQNETAIAQAIASFDGSQIQAKSVQSAALADNINPQIRGAETLANFVFTGCIWSLVSGFSGTMTGGTIYVNGFRVIVSGVGANTFNASNDTYVDIDNLGNVTYQAVSNGANSPTLTVNSIRIAKIVTSGSTITSVVQSGIDTNNVPIYPTGLVAAARVTFDGCKVWRSSAQVIASGGITAVTFDSEDYDTSNYHSTSSNTSRITVPTTGYYLFTHTEEWGTNATGLVNGFLCVNGSTGQRWANIATPNSSTGTIAGTGSVPMFLNANDYMELYVFQNSGGNLNLGGTVDSAMSFTCTRLGT